MCGHIQLFVPEAEQDKGYVILARGGGGGGRLAITLSTPALGSLWSWNCSCRFAVKLNWLELSISDKMRHSMISSQERLTVLMQTLRT